jgi:polar amino acid transport system permease protein
VTWDGDYALKILPDLLYGLWVTVQVTLLAFTISLLVGAVVAVVRHSRVPGLSQFFTFCMWFIRGTPLLVQAYFVYFVLPTYGITLGAFTTGVIVLGINYSAYTAEVYRGGIEGVPAGQWEAAKALSLPRVPTWGRIVLPQAVRSIIPVLGNYLIQMFKDSAILSAITVAEVMQEAQGFANSDFRPLEAYTLVGLLFLMVSYPSSLFVKRLERRYASVH